MTPSTLRLDNSEKLCSDMPVRSAQRRREETLDASKIIHGNSEGNGTLIKNMKYTYRYITEYGHICLNMQIIQITLRGCLHEPRLTGLPRWLSRDLSKPGP